MGENTKNMLIGVFVIVACSLIISIILFLKPSVGDGKHTLYVRFSNINRITIGTRVLFAGKPVGEVVEINELYDARTKPTDLHGQYYFFELVLKVDSSVQVFNTDQIAIQTSGLLGEKSIAIIPKQPPPGVIPKLILNQPIYADSADPFENAIQEIGELANRAEETFRLVNQWIEQNQDNLASAVKSFGQAMDQVDTAVKAVNEQGLITSFKNAADNFADAMYEANDALVTLRKGEAFDNLSATIRNFKGASASIEAITADIAEGKGTLGKLVANDDLYLRVTAIMSKADTLMNDINHYGILFHLNKSWQRIRTKRADFLDALRSPAQFSAYFEEEVDNINTSMSRLSMLIDKAETEQERKEILSNPTFQKDFAELLRRVDEMSDNLRLYNQQLVEAFENSCPCAPHE